MFRIRILALRGNTLIAHRLFIQIRIPAKDDVNILVAREDNKNAENVKEFLQSYQSSEVAKAAETKIFTYGEFLSSINTLSCTGESPVC